MPPYTSYEVIDPSLDSPLGPPDDQQGQYSLSGPVSVGQQPQGCFDQRVENITTNNTLRIIETSETAHGSRTKYATNAFEARSEEIGDASHTLAPNHKLPTSHPSAAGLVNPSTYSDQPHTSSTALEMLEEQERYDKLTETATTMAGAGTAMEVKRAQDTLFETAESVAQTTVVLLESTGNQRASIGQTTDSSGDMVTLIEGTSSNTRPSTPEGYQDPAEPTERGNKAGSVADSLDIYVKDALCGIVSTVLNIQNLTVTVRAWNLHRDLARFFFKQADRAPGKPPPNQETIVDLCCKIIREDTRSIDNQVINIVEDVVKLFKDAGWSLPTQQDDEESFGDSAVFVHGKTVLPAASHGNWGKRPRGDSATSPRPRPNPRKRRSSVQPSVGVSSSRAEDQGGGSLSVANSGRTFQCCEPECKNAEPLRNLKTFIRHYQKHFPPKVAICTYAGDTYPCRHRSSRLDNFPSHFEQHASKSSLPYQKMVTDLKEHTYLIKDVFHEVCPFCPKRHRLRDHKSSEDHIIRHYETGTATLQRYTHRCAKQCHKWECSVNIPEGWRELEVDQAQLDTEDGGASNDRCSSESDSNNERGRSNQFLRRSGNKWKGKAIEKHSSSNSGSRGNQGHGSGGNYNSAAGDQDHLTVNNGTSPADLPGGEPAKDGNLSIPPSDTRGHSAATESTRNGSRGGGARNEASSFRPSLSTEQSRADSYHSISSIRGGSNSVSKHHRGYMFPPGQPPDIYIPRGSVSSTYNHNYRSRFPSERASSVERYVRDGRDHRSLSIREFDAHQDVARRRHHEQLQEVVEKRY